MNSMKRRGMKQIPTFNDYFVTRDGEVLRTIANSQYSITNDIREVSTSVNKKNGKKRFNVTTTRGGGEQKTLHLAQSVYRTYKGEPKGEILFADGNKENCSVENLVTVEDLLNFYRSVNDILN